MVIADSKKEVIRKLNVLERKFGKERTGVNVSKTKVMVGGERHNTNKTIWKWPCEVCGKGVGLGSDSIQCTNCQHWVHKRCGVKGSLCKASKSFVCSDCSVCLCPTDNEVKSCVGDGSSVEIVSWAHAVCEW